jgi:hypothetical protein
MKTAYLLFAALVISCSASAQNLIINGSLETNTATGNSYNLSGNWPSVVSNSWEIDGGVMSLVTSNGCGPASDGNWFVTNCPGCSIFASYLAFSLKLTTPLVSGNQYTVSFDKKYCGDSTLIDIGSTNDSVLIGTAIHTFAGPTSSTWSHESYVFIASASDSYLTVNATIPVSSSGFLALDNFKLVTGAVGIDEPEDQTAFSIYPNPAKDKFTVALKTGFTNARLEIVNLLGEKIYEENKINAPGKEIHPETLSAGIYFVKIFDGAKQSIQKLIIE